MAKEYAKAFYKSKAWESCRKAYIQNRITIDGGMCERCHKDLGYIVHHKVYLTASNIQDPMIALNADNLEYVCHECHNDEHLGIKQCLCTFDEEGRPIKNANAE